MSKLLINESPLQVLPTLAIRLGLNEAIFLQQLHFLTKDKRPGQDGLQWLRRTYPEWKKQTFSFWSTKTIERAAKALAKLSLIKIEQRDKSSRNRDNFYAIDREYYAKWEAGTIESSVSIEPDNLSVSEADNLSPSEADNLGDSHKDQILQSNRRQDQSSRAEDQPKPRRKTPPPTETELPYGSQDYREAWEDFEVHRVEVRTPLGNTQREPLIEQLGTVSEAAGIKIIRDTIRKGYRNFDWYFDSQNGIGANGKAQNSSYQSNGHTAGVRTELDTSLLDRIKRA